MSEICFLNGSKNTLFAFRPFTTFIRRTRGSLCGRRAGSYREESGWLAARSIQRKGENCKKLNFQSIALMQRQSSLPLAVQDLLYGGLRDQVIVALEPLIALLSDEGGVVAGLDRSRMVNDGEQTVSEQFATEKREIRVIDWCY